VGKTTDEEQPRYFMYGRGRWQGKKGRKKIRGSVCIKWGMVLFGGKKFLQKDKILIPHCHLIHRSLSTYLHFYVLPNANVSNYDLMHESIDVNGGGGD